MAQSCRTSRCPLTYAGVQGQALYRIRPCFAGSRQSWRITLEFKNPIANGRARVQARIYIPMTPGDWPEDPVQEEWLHTTFAEHTSAKLCRDGLALTGKRTIEALHAALLQFGEMWWWEFATIDKPIDVAALLPHLPTEPRHAICRWCFHMLPGLPKSETLHATVELRRITPDRFQLYAVTYRGRGSKAHPVPWFNTLFAEETPQTVQEEYPAYSAIPAFEVSLAECQRIAKELGKRPGREFSYFRGRVTETQ